MHTHKQFRAAAGSLGVRTELVITSWMFAVVYLGLAVLQIGTGTPHQGSHILMAAATVATLIVSVRGVPARVVPGWQHGE